MTVLVACGLLLTGCRGVRGVPATRAALEGAGYRDVAISFRSGGGIDLVRVDGTADTVELQGGAAVVWATLPFRFDRLRLVIGASDHAGDATFSYEQMADLFGPRPPGLDRRQVGDEVVVSGLKLVVVLAVAAVLSVGLVLGLTLFALRNVRRRRRSAPGEDHDAWDGSFPEPDSASPTAGAAGVDGPEAIPS